MAASPRTTDLRASIVMRVQPASDNRDTPAVDAAGCYSRRLLPEVSGRTPDNIFGLRCGTAPGRPEFQAVCGPLPIGQVSREHLIDFLQSLHSDGRSAETVNNKRRELLTVIRAAADEELCEVPRRVPRAAPLRREPTAWTLAEVSRLLQVAGQQPGKVGKAPARLYWPALILAVFDSAGRIGAIRRAIPMDYRADPPALLLRAENAKTRTARWCPLSQQADTAISALLASYPAPPRLLFDWQFHPNVLWTHFRRLAESAGILAERTGRGLFHKLRRTSGSLVEAAGGDGARHLGNTRAVFERSYLSPAIVGRGQVGLLPRPE